MKIGDKKKGALKENIWNEIKKINWKKVNEDSMQKFNVVYIGDLESYEILLKELEKSRYDFFGLKLNKTDSLTANAREKLIFVDIAKLDIFQNEITHSEIVIADNKYLSKIREYNIRKNYYIFNSAITEELIEEILSNNERLIPAISFNFPVFRSSASRKKITEVAIQNGAWAAGSAFANVIPGPHQLVMAPLEGASDFTVLTANELRMIFITAGLCGRKIEPLKLIPELIIMLGGAKGAQILATQTLGKVPAGAGNVLKAAIAFSFTFAIGEAVFLNMNYGIKIDSKKIGERVKVLEEYSKEKVAKFLKKKEKLPESETLEETVE